MKWCVVASSEGWGYDLEPYRGPESEGPDSQVFDSFREAKRMCLAYNFNFLEEVRDHIAAIRRIRARNGGL
jgi:hypothetical protein